MTPSLVRGLLFDMDGVLYGSDGPIAGAADAVLWARQQGISHLFITNTTSRDRGSLVEKLRASGIAASEEEILTLAAAVAKRLRHTAADNAELNTHPAQLLPIASYLRRHPWTFSRSFNLTPPEMAAFGTRNPAGQQDG